MRVLGCVALDLTQSRTASDTRRSVDRAIDGLHPADTIRISVGRNSATADLSDLIPPDARIQIIAPDGHTLHAWRAALGGHA